MCRVWGRWWRSPETLLHPILLFSHRGAGWLFYSSFFLLRSILPFAPSRRSFNSNNKSLGRVCGWDNCYLTKTCFTRAEGSGEKGGRIPKCLKMQQCNQGTKPLNPKRQHRKLMQRHLFACLLISHLKDATSCWWSCWWNINKFTWISISILESSSSSFSPPLHRVSRLWNSRERREKKWREEKKQENVIAWWVHKKPKLKCAHNEASNIHTKAQVRSDWWGVKSRYPSLSKDNRADDDGERQQREEKIWWKWSWRRRDVFICERGTQMSFIRPVAYHIDLRNSSHIHKQTETVLVETNF